MNVPKMAQLKTYLKLQLKTWKKQTFSSVLYTELLDKNKKRSVFTPYFVYLFDGNILLYHLSSFLYINISHIAKTPKYITKATIAMKGYTKKGTASNGECKINIELTWFANSLETNVAINKLQYNPITNIIIIEYKICFKLLSNLTFIKPSIGNNVALKSNKECERIPFVISKSNKLGFLIKSTFANITTSDDIVPNQKT